MIVMLQGLLIFSW